MTEYEVFTMSANEQVIGPALLINATDNEVLNYFRGGVRIELAGDGGNKRKSYFFKSHNPRCGVKHVDIRMPKGHGIEVNTAGSLCDEDEFSPNWRLAGTVELTHACFHNLSGATSAVEPHLALVLYLALVDELEQNCVITENYYRPRL